MKATKNGWTVEGTPDEIIALMSAYGDTFETPETKRPPVETATPKAPPALGDRHKGRIDWPKAESLKKAGWSFKAIAEELGLTYQTVYSHFNPAKKPGKED